MSDATRTHNRSSFEPSWVWLLLTAVVLLIGVGFRHPWPADEPRFAQIAREMVESQHWLIPTRGGEPYSDKPPLFIWLSASLFALFRNLKLTFLLPSIFAGIGTLILVRDIAQRLWNREVALASILVLIFTPQFIVQAKSAQMDALVTFWITLGCYGLLRHFFAQTQADANAQTQDSHWPWYCVAWAAMALGVMTKGVGFLPMLMLIPIALWAKTRDHSAPSSWRYAWLGPVVFLAVIALWLAPMWIYASDPSQDLVAYRNDLLFRQTAQRYLNAWHHTKSWHYFFSQAIPTVWFPLAILSVLWIKPLIELVRADRLTRILLSWVGLVLVFFSLSSGKREVYILPALPMLAIVFGVLWSSVRASDRGAGIVFTAIQIAFAALIAGFAIGLLVAPEKLLKKWPEYLTSAPDFSYAFLSIAAAMVLSMIVLRKRNLFERLAGTSLMVWTLVSVLIWPLMNGYRTPADIVEKLDQTVAPNTEVGLVSFKEQFLLFAHRPLTHFSYRTSRQEQGRNAWVWMRESQNRVLFLPTYPELECFDHRKAQVLGKAHRRTWVLLDHSALKADCPAPEHLERFTYQPKLRAFSTQRR